MPKIPVDYVSVATRVNLGERLADAMGAAKMNDCFPASRFSTRNKCLTLAIVCVSVFVWSACAFDGSRRNDGNDPSETATPTPPENQVELVKDSSDANGIGYISQKVLRVQIRPPHPHSKTTVLLEAVPSNANGSVRLCADSECSTPSAKVVIPADTKWVDWYFVADDLVGGSVTLRSAKGSPAYAKPISVSIVGGSLQITSAEAHSATGGRPPANACAKAVFFQHYGPLTGGEQDASHFSEFSRPAKKFAATFSSTDPGDAGGILVDNTCTTKIDLIPIHFDKDIGGVTATYFWFKSTTPGATVTLGAGAGAVGWKSAVAKIEIATP